MDSCMADSSNDYMAPLPPPPNLAFEKKENHVGEVLLYDFDHINKDVRKQYLLFSSALGEKARFNLPALR